MNSDGNKKVFLPHKYKCKNCKDIIFSSYPGEFVWCKCHNNAVDETEYYTRLIGNINELELLEDD